MQGKHDERNCLMQRAVYYLVLIKRNVCILFEGKVIRMKYIPVPTELKVERPIDFVFCGSEMDCMHLPLS